MQEVTSKPIGDVLASVDFTAIEVWTKGGLVTIYLLFVMELATRRVHFAGSTSNPDEPWMLQVYRLFRSRHSTDKLPDLLIQK